jgi:hypothetical protein
LDAYLCLDRFPEAKALAEKVRVQGLDGPRIHQRFLEMAYVEDDEAAAAREIQWFAGKPEEYLSFGLHSAHLNVLGQRREFRKLYQRAAETARHQGLRNAAAEFEFLCGPGARVRARGRHGESPKSLPRLFRGWKDADTDIPILQQAKAEYAKLR